MRIDFTLAEANAILTSLETIKAMASIFMKATPEGQLAIESAKKKIQTASL